MTAPIYHYRLEQIGQHSTSHHFEQPHSHIVHLRNYYSATTVYLLLRHNEGYRSYVHIYYTSNYTKASLTTSQSLQTVNLNDTLFATHMPVPSSPLTL